MTTAIPTPEEQEQHDERSDVKLLQDTSKMLRGFFDTVQIFCTRHDPENSSTISVHWGDGNHYARRGQVEMWVSGEPLGDESCNRPEE